MKTERTLNKIYATVIALFMITVVLGSAWAVTRTITPTSDSIDTYIRNSNGKYWTASGANLQLAINDLTTGGTVYISAGTITPTTNITLANNVRIQGQGNNTLFSTDAGGIQILNKHDVYLSDFSINGRKGIYFYTATNVSNLICENIDITCTATIASDYYPFYFYAADKTMTDIRLTNCRVLNSTTFGFMFSGEGTIARFNNILLENCQAINCGRYNNIDVWATGFDLTEANDYVENMTVINCKAEGCYESGFHFENTPIKKNVKLIGCSSENNGKKSGATYGAGFSISNGVMLYACTSKENSQSGVYLCQNIRGTTIIDDYYDFGSKYGILCTDGRDGKAFINDFVSENATLYGAYLYNMDNVTIDNMNLIEANGSSTSTFCNYLGETGTNYLSNSSINVHIVQRQKTQIYAIFLGLHDCELTGSLLTTCTNGLYLNSCQNTTIHDFILDSSGYIGIWATSNGPNTLFKDMLIKCSDQTADLTYGFYDVSGAAHNVKADKNSIIIIDDDVQINYVDFDYIENWGNTSVANNGTIDHNLTVVPTSVQVTPFNVNLTTHVTAMSATTFKVCLIDIHTGSPPGGSYYVYWYAKV